AGSVTPLAVDPFRNSAPQKKLAAARGFDLRIGIVTEEALLVDPAPEVEMIRPVVAWIHRPMSTVLYVPGDRSLFELAIGSLVQVRSRVIARAEHEIDLLFENVDLPTIGPDLMPALKITAVALVHGEALVRGLVIIACVNRVLAGRRTAEGPSHAG